MEKRKVTILLHHYLPGFKSGGPVRTISNLVEILGDEFAFSVVTSDRDLLDDRPYAGVSIGQWNRVGKAEVMYLPPEQQTFRGIRSVLLSRKADILYLNSFFDFRFAFLPLLAAQLSKLSCPVILAPRGEFSPGALEIKHLKKRAYIELVRLLGLFRNVVWHASADEEAQDIRRTFGPSVRIHIAMNLPFSGLLNTKVQHVQRGVATHRELKLIFLSRISRKKNLDFLLRVLRGVKSSVSLRVFGPIEDEVYWSECRTEIETLPENVRCEYCGELPHQDVMAALGEHDLFVFPTRGENYGHVIMESLASGTPVLISDRTPWNNLEAKQAGWALPLEEADRFREVIERCATFSPEEWSRLCHSARLYAEESLLTDSILEMNRRLFENIVQFAR